MKKKKNLNQTWLKGETVVLAIAYEIVLSVVGIDVTPHMCHPQVAPIPL